MKAKVTEVRVTADGAEVRLRCSPQDGVRLAARVGGALDLRWEGELAAVLADSVDPAKQAPAPKPKVRKMAAARVTEVPGYPVAAPTKPKRRSPFETVVRPQLPPVTEWMTVPEYAIWAACSTAVARGRIKRGEVESQAFKVTKWRAPTVVLIRAPGAAPPPTPAPKPPKVDPLTAYAEALSEADVALLCTELKMVGKPSCYSAALWLTAVPREMVFAMIDRLGLPVLELDPASP